MLIESVMPSSHLILCRPLLLLPPIPPSIKVFSSESTLRMRWTKYWSFSFSISPSNEHPGLISFRMDWLDLLSVQGTLKSLLQHHSPSYLVKTKKDGPSSLWITISAYNLIWFSSLAIETSAETLKTCSQSDLLTLTTNLGGRHTGQVWSCPFAGKKTDSVKLNDFSSAGRKPSRLPPHGCCLFLWAAPGAARWWRVAGDLGMVLAPSKVLCE